MANCPTRDPGDTHKQSGDASEEFLFFSRALQFILLVPACFVILSLEPFICIRVNISKL